MKARNFLIGFTLFQVLFGSSRLWSQPDEESRKGSEASSPGRPIRQAGFSTGGLKNQWSAWSGISFDSPAGTFIGVTEDREFFVAAVQYGHTIAANRKVVLEYTFDLIPLAIVTKNPKLDSVPSRVSGSDRESFYVGTLSSVYGFGVSPIGFKIYFLQDRHARLFFAASGGFLTFEEKVPHPDARKFNFTFDFGAGIQILARSNWGLTLGYKLHHLSNANTANANPGLDANILYLGISSFR